jgi:hypothetical protein
MREAPVKNEMMRSPCQFVATQLLPNKISISKLAGLIASKFAGSMIGIQIRFQLNPCSWGNLPSCYR